MNYDQLHPEAKKFAESLGMTPVCTNPYFNSVAQVVEIVHSAYEGLRLFDELIAEGVVEEPLVQPTRFGSGASAVEVPRGILFHEYAYDEEGLCTDANCIIPTGQNHANIQADFDALLARSSWPPTRPRTRCGSRSRCSCAPTTRASPARRTILTSSSSADPGVRYLIGIGNYYGRDDSIGLRIAEHIGESGLDRGFRAVDLGGNLLDLVHYLDAGDRTGAHRRLSADGACPG